MTQPSLLDALVRADKPRKRVRQVSRQAYAEVRATDAGRMRDNVLRNLAAYFNRHASWPTDSELTRWMVERGELVDMNPNFVRPRRNELMEMGLVEAGEKRRCTVSGKKAHPWRIRER